MKLRNDLRGEAADERAIRELDAAWSQALQNKDLDKAMSNYAEDAVFLAPNSPLIEGKAKIRERFARRMASSGFSASFTPPRIVVSKSRDLAYEPGTFRVSVNDEHGQPTTSTGNHLVTWKKLAGKWKVTAESINYD